MAERLAELYSVARGAAPVPLAPADRERIAAARAVVEAAVAEDRAVYGVTTGFGHLAEVHIPPAQAAQLQVNLVRSHAVGSGEPLPEDVVRGMIHALSSSAPSSASSSSSRCVSAACASAPASSSPSAA